MTPYILELPDKLQIPAGARVVWAIHDHPYDYPHGHLLRACFVLPDGETEFSDQAWGTDHIEMLREILWALGRTPRVRDTPDDLETWE